VVVACGVTLILGVTALILRGVRRASVLASPIVALVLCTIILLLSGLAWLGQTAVHDQGITQPLVFPQNPQMTELYTTTQSIERGIRAGGSAYHWPGSVTADADGRVVVGGKLLGILRPGQTLVYEVTKGGEDFQLRINATVAGEYYFYDLDTHEIISNCYASDTTCSSN
jgi:hypothetical protein